ncbi:MAG: hypothetical protein ACOCUS_02965, partial [Polyangiales bacterium]
MGPVATSGAFRRFFAPRPSAPLSDGGGRARGKHTRRTGRKTGMSKSELIVATLIVAALATVGCARSMNDTRSEQAGPTLAHTSGASETARQGAADAAEPQTAEASSGTHDDLPQAPWSADRLAADEAPSTLVDAWKQASNRDWCAPMSPSSFGEGEGADARMSELHGGWSVEFDKAGAPGMRPDGDACDDCGRATFGIAGTGMAPEELVAVEEGDAPAPSFSDGSHAEVTAEPEVAAVLPVEPAEDDALGFVAVHTPLLHEPFRKRVERGPVAAKQRHGLAHLRVELAPQRAARRGQRTAPVLGVAQAVRLAGPAHALGRGSGEVAMHV